MPNVFLKNKFTIGLMTAIIFSLSFGTAFAETGTVPAPPIGYPMGLPFSPGVPAMDVAVQTNTNLLVTNTYSAASSLSGMTPGAQQDKVKSGILMIILRRVLRQITMSIVTWINSGFNGGPSFITNTGQFLQNTADITIGDFLLNDPSLSFLCDPFKLQVKLALGLQYRPFKDEIKCSFTSAMGNVTNAMNDFANGDFIGGGGWDSWLQMTTVPQNNQMGAMLLAQGELDSRITTNTNQATLEANWGGGFLSWKKCTTLYGPDAGKTTNSMNTNLDYAATVNGKVVSTNRSDTAQEPMYGPSNTNCTIQTPGQTIADQLNYFDKEDLREAGVANDLNEIVNALANQLISKGMQMFTGGGLLGANKPGSNNGQTNYNNYLTAADKASMASQGISLSPDGTSFIFTSSSTASTATLGGSAITTVQDALNFIQMQKNIEQNYQTNLIKVINMLYADNTSATSSAYISFANKQSCNSYIKTNVLDRIDGTKTYDVSDSNRLALNENLNRPALEQMLAQSIINVSSLTNLANNISTATDESVINMALNQAINNNANMHTQADIDSFAVNGSRYLQIRAWLAVMQYAYSGTDNACIADLSEWGI